MIDIKTAEELLKKTLSMAPEYGFDEYEISYSSGTSMEISVFEGEIQSYERSDEQGLIFKGKKNGQMASSATNELDEDAIRYLLQSASESCDVLDDEDEDFIYCDPDNPRLIYSQITDAFSKNTYSSFAKLGLELEKDIFALDPSIKAVDYLSISCDRGLEMKMNSKGLYAYKDSDFVSLFAEARAEKDGQVKTGGHYWYGNDIDKFDKEAFLKVFKHKVTDKFGGSSVPSGKYRIILGNEAVISFFSTFMGNFSSYAMQKGISLLQGREGEMIASECFSLKETPMLDKALIKVPFDSEGVMTTEKYLIENGKFIKALYNLKTANKEGIKSTGNGMKGGIGITNTEIIPGDLDLNGLAEEIGSGLYITELNGLHAGVNTISGDFSLFCEGYKIEDGKITGPVEQITVSDNYYSVLKKISKVGNDIISEYMGSGEFFAPSIIIDDISVAGDK